MATIVVTGSRTWTDEAAIKSELQHLQAEYGSDLTIVVGYDPVKKKPTGVDKLCYKWCNALGINVITEPADWANGRFVRFGDRNVNMAGFDRNELMLDKHKPDYVWAFRARGISNGTDHCIEQAEKRGIIVETIHG